MKKLLLSLAFCLGFTSYAHAVNPIYGTVRITTTTTMTPPFQNGSIYIASATIGGPLFATGTFTTSIASISSATISTMSVVSSTITRLSASSVLPAISPTLGTMTSSDSLSTLLSKIANQRVVQIQQGTRTGFDSSTSATFTNATLSVAITPQSTANKVLLIGAGALVQESSGTLASATLARGATNLGGSSGFCQTYGPGQITATCSMVFLDSPLLNTATTYFVQYKSDGTHMADWGNSNLTSTLTAIEIGQ